MTDQTPPGSGPGRGVPGPRPGRDHPAGCSPDQRRSLGSYALGALDPIEADQVRRHLVDCPECRIEYRDMAAMPALLSRIPQVEMEVGAVAVRPGQDMLTRLLERAAVHEGAAAGAAAAAAPFTPAQAAGPAQWQQHQPGAAGAHHRRRAPGARGVSGLPARMLDRWRQGSSLHRVSIATAGTAIVAAAAVGAYAATSSSAPAPAFAKTLSAQNSATGISGIVDYHSADWGSWVQVTMRGVPSGDDCSLIAVDSKGDRAIASTWTAPADGTATIPGGLAMQAPSIVEFEVITTSGSTLLTIPVR
ncbi:MAG TPA: zf-HC2 domain-containing protein [Actinocrinis sp.]